MQLRVDARWWAKLRLYSGMRNQLLGQSLLDALLMPEATNPFLDLGIPPGNIRVSIALPQPVEDYIRSAVTQNGGMIQLISRLPTPPWPPCFDDERVRKLWLEHHSVGYSTTPEPPPEAFIALARTRDCSCGLAWCTKCTPLPTREPDLGDWKP